MTRSVEDATIMLEAIAGYDTHDASSLQVGVPDITGSLKIGIKGVRICVDNDYLTDGVETSLLNSIKNAVEKMEELGAVIVPIKFPGNKEELGNAWFTLSSKEAVFAHRKTYTSRKAEYGAFFREFLDYGNSITEDNYSTALHYRENFTKLLRKLFSEVDVVAAPTGGMPNVLSEDVIRGPMSGWDPYLQEFDWHFATPANFAGTPALTLPCGEAKEGAPPGFQLMGDLLSESVLCTIGFTFEQATNWNKQHPNI